MIPDGFVPLRLPASAYLSVNGPFYANWDGECFVLGLRVEPRHCNAAGTCHGGMIATLCDVLLTVGSNIQSGQSRFLPTVTMSCDFMAPAAEGAWIEGRLSHLRATGTLLFASGMLRTQANGEVARTSGVLRIRGEPDRRFHASRYFDTKEPS